MELKDALRVQMEEKGFTVARLARETGIKYEYLRLDLSGKRRMTGCELLKVLRVLDLSLEDTYESVFGD